MDNIKSALKHLEDMVVFIPDSELQIEVEHAINDLHKELRDRAEAPDTADEICYKCKNMCSVRRKYIGGVMRMCGIFERTEKQ